VRRIYVTEEAYEALVKYCLEKNKTLRGMAWEVSQLILRAIAQESVIPVSQHPSSPLTHGPTGQQSIGPVSQHPTGSAPQGSRARKARVENEGVRRRHSPLDEVEDVVLIRGARNPSALVRAAQERGLRAYDFSGEGFSGAVAVFRSSFAEFAKTVAEADNPSLQSVEDRAHKLLRGRKGLESIDDKLTLVLYILNREGEVLWDGSRWVEPSKARPAPQPEASKQVQGQQTPQQPAQGQQPPVDEKVREWLRLFEKEFPHVKTAMFVWRVRDFDALVRLAGQHGLKCARLTAEKVLVYRPEFIKDACSIANERGWTRESVENVVADVLRGKPRVLADDELAALALEVALGEGLARYKDGRWVLL
jgi:hypothetical protein